LARAPATIDDFYAAHVALQENVDDGQLKPLVIELL
jgi:hypothetical protein